MTDFNSSPEDRTPEPGTAPRLARAAVVALAGVVVGLVGAVAVHAAPSERPVVACPASEADLLQAAEAARRFEIMHPATFETSPRPADFDDLRLAAEWARRLAILAPHTIPEHCTP